MRLTYRFCVAFVIVVIVSGGVLVVTFDTHRTDVLNSAEDSVAERAELSATMLDDRIREQQRTLAIAANNPDVRAHGTERQGDTLEQLVDVSAFGGVTVVDETGAVRAIETRQASTSVTIVGTDLSDRRYVDRSLRGEEYVSDPLEAETGNDVIVVSTPIREDGEIVGSLNGAYHIDDERLFEPIAEDDQGAITVEADGETVFTNADHLDETIEDEAMVGTVGWTVTAHRERGEVTGSIDRLVLFQTASAVALLGSVTGFAVWIYRSKVRRIGRILERLRALERREYGDEPAIGGAAEWRRIDRALDGLAGSLARREQMLLVLNRILRHNLRNTLNLVVGHADDLESRLDGENRESAAEIAAATRELLELADRARTTESLLDPIDDETLRTDVATITRERVDAFDAASRSRDLETVIVDGPEQAIAACGEGIGIAIDELLANAADHAGPNPSVTIEIEPTPEWIRLAVEDDGPGIPPEDISVITGEQELSQVNHAGGIGLWLVDWIVSRYGGRLSISSSESATAGDVTERDDAGSTVVLELPRPAEPTPPTENEAGTEDARSDRIPTQ
ncbi:ATP-binding protein [Natrialba sp. INN-245]|uniref:sensor histidine kinase n=1 Tax=Natrialba sp. INN-245 TaxID=2690967 RepID=UPI001310A765|nr:ATP-binding protein [Natrialba sp. INN-245]MWV39717.1 sensor histidine kinase [Natrialba sp. INN-245]